MSKVSRRTVLKAGSCALVAAAGIRQVKHANAETGPRSKHQEIVQRIDPALASLKGGFVSETAQVNATRLHYVRGGTGPAVILLHGFPEDWYAYHRVMPLAADHFDVADYG